MLALLAGPAVGTATASPGAVQRRAGVVALTTLAAALTALSVLPAAAAPNGSTTANVSVGSMMTLSGLTASFGLTGLPGATVTAANAVTMNVETNNVAGYIVTVQAAAATLTPADTTANPNTIPIGALSVREHDTATPGAAYTALSATTPVTVHTQGDRSASGGDTIDNDYKVVVPFVNADTYSVVLNYIATAQ